MNCFICKKHLWFWQKKFLSTLHLKCFIEEFKEDRMHWDKYRGFIWDHKL